MARTLVQPMFKWTGSKQRMMDQYAPHFFPAEVNRFVDLFAGGLTTALWVVEKFPSADLVINDFNSELVLLYRTLATNERAVTKVWQECVDRWLPLTPAERKAVYYQWRDEYCLDFESKSDVRLSGLLLFMLQVNFNGMWKAYIKCNGRYSTPPGTCQQKAAFFDARKIRNVAEILARPNTTILTGDFGSVPLREGDFVYADPPYRDSVVEYQGGFTETDQVRLANLLTAHDGDFAYSNKDIGDGFFETHFPNAHIYPVSATYTAGRGTSVLNVREVLVTNFPGQPFAPADAQQTRS